MTRTTKLIWNNYLLFIKIPLGFIIKEYPSLTPLNFIIEKNKLVRLRSNQSKYTVNTTEVSHTIELLSIPIDTNEAPSD